MLRIHRVLAIAVSSVLLASSIAGAAPRPFRIVGPKLSPLAQPALERLNSIASRPFTAIPSRVNGAAFSIMGGAVPTNGADRTEAARAFFIEHGALFGLDGGVDLVKAPRGNTDRRVTFELHIDGVPVDSARAIASFDASGDLVAASVGAPKSFETLGPFRLDENEAKAAGSAAMRVMRAGLGHKKLAEFGAPIAHRVWERTKDGLVPAWKTDHYTMKPGEAWTIVVDGRNGKTLRTQDGVDRGTGFFPMDYDPMSGNLSLTSFPTQNGKGSAFETQSAAIKGKRTTEKFFDLAAPPPGGNPIGAQQGNLVGAHLHVFTDTNPFLFSPNLKFPKLNPFNAEADQFDQSNIYFQIDRFYRHLRSITGGDLASNFSVPVEVNFDPGDFVVNAFFSSAPFPNPTTPYTLGSMLFHDLTGYLSDENVLCGPEFDLSRDAVAGCHEYTHGWLFYEELNFFGTIECPGRTINEAMADVFATAFHDDILVGRYLGATPAGQLAFPDGGLRVLNGDAHYPETTQESLRNFDFGGGNFFTLAEEHLNSVMFSSMSRDLAREIGNKRVEQHMFDALPGMPHTEGDVGFDFGDVVSDPFAATDVFQASCANSLLLLNQPLSHYLAELGTMTGRGIFGSLDPSNGDLFNSFFVLNNLELFPNRKMTLPSVLPRSTCGQIYFFQAKAGRTLKVTLKTDNGQSFRGDFVLAVFNGGSPADITAKQKHVKNGGRVVTQKFVLHLPLDANSDETDPFYGLLIGANSGSGRFTVTIDA